MQFYFNCILLVYFLTQSVNLIDLESDSNLNSTLSTTTSKPVNHTKEFILCELAGNNSQIRSNCNLYSYNFTFYALFSTRQKRASKSKNLKELVKTLSKHSSCQIRYMKYNFWNENLEYINSTEENYWYEGKRLDDKFKANVYILSDSKKKLRKTIIFECILPKSDVYLSLNPLASRLSHSRPFEPKPVTVSGFHLKLNFMPISGINVKTKKKISKPNDEYEGPSGVSYVVTAKPEEKEETQSAQRFMVFFDGKCRSCYINVASSTLDSDLLVDPTFFRSVRCQLKPNSCIYNGKCYFENERINRTTYQQYVCNTKYNLISSAGFQPCAKNNGNCDMHQQCEYDEENHRVNCIDKFL